MSQQKPVSGKPKPRVILIRALCSRYTEMNIEGRAGGWTIGRRIPLADHDDNYYWIYADGGPMPMPGEMVTLRAVSARDWGGDKEPEHWYWGIVRKKER